MQTPAQRKGAGGKSPHHSLKFAFWIYINRFSQSTRAGDVVSALLRARMVSAE
jgi:hypothetical protein